MAGMLGVGLTGLNAAQAGLLTTSHNISNANTPGFSRQTASFTTNTPQFSGSGFFGQGTRVDAVRREYDQFLNQQVMNASTRREYFASYDAALSQIENLLGDESAGLSSAMSEFFRGVNDVANNPTSIPSRQAMISLAESLAGRFQSMNTRLNEIRDLNEGQIAGSISEINGYAKQIAALNERIAQMQLSGPTIQANDLHDQRNHLVSELNKFVKVSSFEQSDGSLNIFIGSGQSLVIGNSANTLKAVAADPADPLRNRVFLQTGGTDVELPESLLGGGQLGAALDFRSQALDGTQEQLGRIALELASQFNDGHKDGFDLDGNGGKAFFADLSAMVASPVDPNDPSQQLQFRQDLRRIAGAFAVSIDDPREIAAAGIGNAVGDNRNILALAEMQTSKLMNGGTATFQSAYAQLVSSVGNKAREVQIASKAQEAQLQQATAARDALSGVNLDEEAANLIRFQQSYQAAARVMSLSSTLFDEVLSIGR